MRTFIRGCAVLLALTMGYAQAATICVDKKDTLEVKCKNSIQNGVDAYAAPGDVVAIKAGTYFEAVTVPVTADGIIIKGSGKAIIDPAATGSPGLTIDAPNAVVSGLTINNTNSHGIYVQITATTLMLSKITVNNAIEDCVSLDTVDDVVITGSKFFSCGGDGIDVLGNGAEITKNKFTHVGGSAVHVEGDDHLIESNACARVGRCVRADPGSDNVVVRRNKTVEHTDTAIEVEGNNAIIESNTGVNGGGLIEVEGTNPQVLANKSKADGGGIRVTCATCATALVERNSLVSTRGSGGMGGGNACIDLDFDSAGGMLLTNTIKECSRSAFRIRGAGAVTAEKNKSTASGYGQQGAFVIEEAGIKTLTGNSVTFSGGNGIQVEGVAMTPIAHVLQSNKSSKNGQDGFNLDADTSTVVLTGNTAVANIQEGFDDRGMSNVYSENKASKNRGESDFCATGFFVDSGDNKFATDSSPDCVYP